MQAIKRGVIALFGIVLLLILARPIVLHAISETQTVVVDDKWTKRLSDGDDRYLVAVRPMNGTNIEVMEVSDEWAFLSFDAADRYAKLQRGQTKEITSTGFRVPILSWFRNIVAVK